MTTRLDGTLKREIEIEGAPYVLTLTPEGLRLTPKGRRKGYELAWTAFVNGEAALAQALSASLSGGPVAARGDSAVAKTRNGARRTTH